MHNLKERFMTHIRSSCPPQKPLTELTEELGEYLGHIMKMSGEIIGPTVLFDKYPDVNSIFYVGNTGVRQEFRRRGIARTLAEFASKVCRLSNGFASS